MSEIEFRLEVSEEDKIRIKKENNKENKKVDLTFNEDEYSELEIKLYHKIEEKKIIDLDELSQQELGALGKLKQFAVILKDRNRKKKYVKFIE